MDISENIKRIRKQRNMTQKQLASDSGLAVTTIQQYEAGKYKPKNASLKKLAAALNCDFSDLIDVYAIDELDFPAEQELKNDLIPILKQLGYEVGECSVSGSVTNPVYKFRINKDGVEKEVSSEELYKIKKQVEESLSDAQRALFIVKVGELLDSIEPSK